MSESWKQEFVTYLEESTSATLLVSQALAVKEQNLPARVYKYRCDNSYTRTNLETDCVWTCSPAKYNDPYDSWLSMPSNVLAQLLEQSLEKKSGNAKKYSGGVSQVALNTAKNLKIFRDLAKVCSFSEVHDSILMWSHYSDHHRGLCIEYDLTVLPYHHAFRRNLYPVFYSADLYDLAKFAEALAGPGQNFRPMMPLLAMLYKFEGWQYEREWRFVREVPQVQPDTVASAPVRQCRRGSFSGRDSTLLRARNCSIFAKTRRFHFPRWKWWTTNTNFAQPISAAEFHMKTGTVVTEARFWFEWGCSHVTGLGQRTNLE